MLIVNRSLTSSGDQHRAFLTKLITL